jgi:hypothetical protein
MTSPPEADLDLIRGWCAKQWTEEFRDEVRCEAHVDGTRVVLCETRAPWNTVGGWSHEEFAGLAFRSQTNDWTLSWVDSESQWHDYAPDGSPVVGSCADLLAEIDRDPTNIFKG